MKPFTPDQNAQPLDYFPVMPKGYYTCHIAEVEEKENSKRTGRMIKVKLKIIDGKFKGRVVYDHLNYEHENTTAMEISKTGLSLLCKACYIDLLEDEFQLLNHLVQAKIEVKVKPGEEEMETKIYNYVPAETIIEEKDSPPPMAPTGEEEFKNQQALYKEDPSSSQTAPPQNTNTLEDDINF